MDLHLLKAVGQTVRIHRVFRLKIFARVAPGDGLALGVLPLLLLLVEVVVLLWLLLMVRSVPEGA